MCCGPFALGGFMDDPSQNMIVQNAILDFKL